MVRRLIGAVCAVMLLSTMGAGAASAESWGPRTSTYNNVVRVAGNGTLTREAGGSRSYFKAVDKANDGNAVYAYTKWYRLTEVCRSFGVDYVIVATASSCEIQSSIWLKKSTSMISGLGKSVSYNTRAEWCDADAETCANYGLKAVAGACADMGFPLPDNCTWAYVEWHRP